MQIPFSRILRQVGIPGDDCQVINGISNFLISDNFHKKNVFVITHDSIADLNLFLPLDRRKMQPIESIRFVAHANPGTNFFIINNCLNLGAPTANLHFLSWAPEWITNPFADYRDTDPIEGKKLLTNKVWISLNNNRKVHRYLTAMYLLGAGLDRHGHLRIDPLEMYNHDSWDGWIYWWHYNDHENIKDIEQYFPILQKGFLKLKQNNPVLLKC